MQNSTAKTFESSSSSGNGSNDAGDFECNICFELAQDPIVTLCGHLYCWPCLYRWLRLHSQSHECPVCKALIQEEKLVPLYGRGRTSTDPRSKPVLKFLEGQQGKDLKRRLHQNQILFLIPGLVLWEEDFFQEQLQVLVTLQCLLVSVDYSHPCSVFSLMDSPVQLHLVQHQITHSGILLHIMGRMFTMLLHTHPKDRQIII